LKRSEQYTAISFECTSYSYAPLGHIIPTENQAVFALTH